jgi:hypothetical protein
LIVVFGHRQVPYGAVTVSFGHDDYLRRTADPTGTTAASLAGTAATTAAAWRTPGPAVAARRRACTAATATTAAVLGRPGSSGRGVAASCATGSAAV